MTMPYHMTHHFKKIALPALLGAASLISALVLAACDNDTSGSATQTTVTPAVVSGQTRGETVYMRYCNVCHPGGGRGSGPSLIEAAPRWSDDRIRAIVRQGEKRMPPFSASSISDDDLTDLVAYIRTLK